MAETEPLDERERAGLASAGSLAQPERRPLARRAAGPAVPGRGVRADRREGHDRVHDPGGRSTGRSSRCAASTSTSTARTSCSSRCSRRPIRESVEDLREVVDAETDPLARLRAFSIRLHEWCDPAEPRKRGVAQPPADLRVLGAARGHATPSACAAAMAPQSRHAARPARRRGRGRRDQGRPTPAAPPRSSSRPCMYSWFGNRLVQNPRHARHRRGHLGVLPPRPRG